MEHQQLSTWFSTAQPALLAYAKRLARPSINGVHDAEDIIQDALFAALTNERAREIGSEKSFGNWIRAVIRNRVYEIRRKNKSRDQGHEKGAEFSDRDLIAPKCIANPSHPPIVGGAPRFSAEKLSVLPFEERCVIVMRDNLKIDWEAAAGVLVRSVASAKSLRLRALRKIGPSGHGART